MPPQAGFALGVALHSTDGAAEFWETCREHGLADGELLAHMDAAMGNNMGRGGGGLVGAGRDGFAWRTDPPRLWLGLRGDWSRRKPTLEGEELLTLVRRLLKIPRRA